MRATASPLPDREPDSREGFADVETFRSQGPFDTAGRGRIGPLLCRHLGLFPDRGRQVAARQGRGGCRDRGENARAAAEQDAVGEQSARGFSRPARRRGLGDDARPVPCLSRKRRRNPPALLRRRAGSRASIRRRRLRPSIAASSIPAAKRCGRSSFAGASCRRSRGLGRSGRAHGRGLARGRPPDGGTCGRAAAALRPCLCRPCARAAADRIDPRRPRTDRRRRPHGAAAAVRSRGAFGRSARCSTISPRASATRLPNATS